MEQSEHKQLQKVVGHGQTPWFYCVFLDFVRYSFDETWQKSAGCLYSLCQQPVHKKCDFRLYSALVHGLGRASWCEWGMARMEWLALELIVRLQMALVSFMGVEEHRLEVFWSPHKMIYDGHVMSSLQNGANDRADFHLVAIDSKNSTSQVLCTIYLTTNMPKHAFSGRSHVVVFGIRLLFRG